MAPTRKAGCRRNRKQYGGGVGGVVGFGTPSFGTLVNNPIASTTMSSCQAVKPEGYVTVTPRGLPGFQSGGKRSRKNSRKNSRKAKQYGGSYGFSGTPGIVAGFPGGASYPPIQSTGCSAPSSVDIPASGADGTLNKVGSYLWDGKASSALQRGGSYQLGEMLKTAGYTTLDGSPASTIPTSAGTLLSVNIPVDGRISGHLCGMNPQKGGKRISRMYRKSRKNSKKSRKNRKNSKKSKY
jgi:hypothetical protein